MNDMIKGSFIVNKQVPYEALSYCSDSLSFSSLIKIEVDGKEYNIAVTSNLVSALRELRSPDKGQRPLGR